MKDSKLQFKFLLLIITFLISTNISYSQWIIAGDLTGIGGRPTVSVVDQNTAFVTGGSGSNFTYKTTNGGTNWTQLNTGSFNLFWCIWAKDASTVFAGATGNGNPDTIKLYKTTNGGNNWTVVESNYAEVPTFTGIKFSNSDPSFGIAVGGAPDLDFYIYKTRDGGDTWTGTQITGFSGYLPALNSLNVIDSLFYAFGIGFTSPSIIITTDGGVTWNLRDLNNPSPGLSTGGIAFKEDKLTGIAGAALPIISRTTNGGLNWVNIDVGNNVTSANCRMRWIEGTNTCYINATDANNGGVLKSTDGGLTWSQMSTSDLGIYNFDTKRIGSNVYGYANASAGGVFGGTQVLKVTDVITGLNQISELVPDGYSLSQNYPNPFNPITVIRYSLIENRFTTLKVYDILGNEVTTLVNEKQNAGSYEVDFDGSNFSSGVYFYRLEVDGNIIDIKRMMLLK
ncbi:MAG: T9SS type A sorting domain-containing protein [Bacteroidota bacterium]|nr:T9SS type A sorting domain-containing protein [Bacteroidota bacterium]